MSRVLLQQWQAQHLRAGPVVERDDGHEQALDRWLAGWHGWAAPWLSAWRCRRLRADVAAVLAQEAALQALDEAGLDAHLAATRARLQSEGLTRGAVQQGFALVREVSRRTLGKAHYPAQLTGGLVLLDGRLAEMQTGEGKTLTALLPAVTVALAGAPAHVVTVNDYLAARDAQIMEPVYRRCGLQVGVVVEGQEPEQRQAAWRCPVVYTTNKDLVFDYLRDQLDHGGRHLHAAVRPLLGERGGAAARRLRGLYFVLIDEADSVLVDEARTPLILSAERPGGDEAGAWAAALEAARALEPGIDFRLRLRERQIELLPAGQVRIDALCQGMHPLLAARRARQAMVQQGLSALHLFQRDRQYIVREHEGKPTVQIVDENTGRVMPDRTWERGLHQMVELKEGLAASNKRDTLSRLTYQRFFRRYLRLCGMSGTAMEVAAELRSVYALDVVRVPTHRPVQRRQLGARVYWRAQARWQAVAERAREFAAQGRAVLIGTRSVGASESVSAALQALGLEHALLNARQDAAEAEIVAQAGQPGRITVATNMAGRGTDILLHDAVRTAGGLHVILTEFHESARVDRQLYGRAGRQGDPGSCEALVSLEDDLFSGFGALPMRLVRALLGHAHAAETDTAHLPSWLGQALRRWAQQRAEAHFSAVRRRTITQDRELDRRLAFGGKPI
ncbi:MAG: hypothetical protein KBC73_03160 [Burkholderiaceae bacterium]|nr:hypothetical protein [Burkholderiaceae bacterium]